MSKQFKGWTIPGPTPPLPTPEIHKHFNDRQVSLDAIAGNYRIYQYNDGHRFSTDDLLTAWYASQCAVYPKRILDLGSGIGSVALMEAFKFPGSLISTLEAQRESFELAIESIKYNGLEAQIKPTLGDLRETVSIFGENRFDLITGSPPYFDHATGIISENSQKKDCRFESRGDVGDYIRAASNLLAPGGVFVCIFPYEPQFQTEKVTKSAEECGLQIVRKRKAVFKEGQSYGICLYAMMKASDLPENYRVTHRNLLWEESPLTIRDRDGKITPDYSLVKLGMGFPP